MGSGSFERPPVPKSSSVDDVKREKNYDNSVLPFCPGKEDKLDETTLTEKNDAGSRSSKFRYAKVSNVGMVVISLHMVDEWPTENRCVCWFIFIYISPFAVIQRPQTVLSHVIRSLPIAWTRDSLSKLGR